jgi:hypothetical protein
VEAQIAVVIRDGHFLEHVAVCIGFDEEIGPAPINGVFVVRADALEVAWIDAFAGGGVEIGRVERLKGEESENEQTHGSDGYLASPCASLLLASVLSLPPSMRMEGAGWRDLCGGRR